MESISDLSNMVVSNARSGQAEPVTQSKFTKEERAPIAYFFVRLSEIYGTEYSRQLVDSHAETCAKREWGDKLKHYDRAQLEKGMEYIKNLIVDDDEGWKFMNIGRCVGAILEANRSTAAHKALPAPEGKRMDKAEALSLFAAMRANTGLELAEPKLIDTTSVESELEVMPVIRRDSDV